MVTAMSGPDRSTSRAPGAPAPSMHTGDPLNDTEIRAGSIANGAIPTAASTRLFQLYQGAGAESGLKIEGEFTGGCADSGFTAQMGAPTICGVGPVGGKAHSPEEYLEIASLVPRAQAMARAILRLEGVGL